MKSSSAYEVMEGVYEGECWQAKVILSGRWGDRIEWTCCYSDRVWTWHDKKAEKAIKELESGINPDVVVERSKKTKKQSKN